MDLIPVDEGGGGHGFHRRIGHHGLVFAAIVAAINNNAGIALILSAKIGGKLFEYDFTFADPAAADNFEEFEQADVWLEEDHFIEILDMTFVRTSRVFLPHEQDPEFTPGSPIGRLEMPVRKGQDLRFIAFTNDPDWALGARAKFPITTIRINASMSVRRAFRAMHETLHR